MTTFASSATGRTPASRRPSPCSLAALVVASLLAAANAQAATITRGPLQQLVRPGAITVVVELDEPAAVSVCCGAAAPWDTCYDADAPATRHELHVLRPDEGTLQCFVADAGGASLSEMFPVHAEPSGDAPWTFMIIGDTRSAKGSG
jgi:hypothetical protein